MPSWKHVDINTKQGFRGLAAVDASTAWVGGSAGGVWRTTDAGKTWHKVGPELTKPLLFRDVEAIDADHAQILAIGPGRKSRIYRTTDGGATWERTFTNKDQDAFYDCMAMYPDGVHGLAMSDPVRRQVPDHPRPRTAAAPGRWSPARGCPRPSTASSASRPAAPAWSPPALRRLLRLRRRRQPDLLLEGLRQTWKVGKSRIPAAEAGGVFSLAFKDSEDGIAVGGDFTVPDNGDECRRTAPASTGRPAATSAATAPASPGCRASKPVAVAVGPTGSDITKDGGAVLEGLRRRVLRRRDVRRRRRLLGVRGRRRGRHPPPLTPDRSVSCYRTVTF